MKHYLSFKTHLLLQITSIKTSFLGDILTVHYLIYIFCIICTCNLILYIGFSFPLTTENVAALVLAFHFYNKCPALLMWVTPGHHSWLFLDLETGLMLTAGKQMFIITASCCKKSKHSIWRQRIGEDLQGCRRKEQGYVQDLGNRD